MAARAVEAAHNTMLTAANDLSAWARPT